MKNIIIALLTILCIQQLAAQVVKGKLTQHKQQQISLVGFDYYRSFELGKTTTDSIGNFAITYSKDYIGMAIVKIGQSSTILILNKDSIALEGTHLMEYDSLHYTNSFQNSTFLKIAKGNSLNDQAYAGLRYLMKVYANPYFKKQEKTLENINTEIKRIEGSNMLEKYAVPQKSYLYWYAPLRKLISDMPQTYRNYTERIPETIEQFRKIDFTQPNFKTSGLFRDIIEGHYLLLENMGQPLDSVYTQMNLSTDYLIDNLKQNDSVLNNVSEELFKLFEKRSLYKVAAHLSEKLLSSEDCACFIEQDLQKEMQKYVTLKVGNIAPDIQLTATKKLSHLKQNVLLVFGSSTCPTCKKDALQLMEYYIKWKENKTPLEVVYISLDTDQATFDTAFKDVPWPSYCDFKGWDMQAVKDYYVNATPTYLLLDKDQTILLHPRSVAHVNAWIQNKL